MKPLLTEDERRNAGGSVHPHTEYGCGELTLRDYFAAAAIQGLLAYPGDEHKGSYHNNCDYLNTANVAYKYADAMLATRKPVAK